MPIELESPVQPVSQAGFHAIDEVFTGLVFRAQNEIGSLCDEKIYENELYRRCAESGIGPARKEFRIIVRHADFEKTYRIDMLLINGVIYEFKCAEKIVPAHQAQLLNYLLLTGLQHGKIFNFRPQRVEFRFVSTQLTPERRFNFHIDDTCWQDRDEDGAWFKQTVVAFLNDWGAFLDFELFYEAIRCFRGGDENVIQRIEIRKGNELLGTQRAHLLNPTAAFRFSAVTKDVPALETQLRKFLALTSLACIQWVNFNHHNIEFRTITRHEHNSSSFCPASF